MVDKSKPVSFFEDGKVAVYRKQQRAEGHHRCDGTCGKVILSGSQYVRIQYVRTWPKEDLHKTGQARDVAYRRRVVLKFHIACVPEEVRS